MQENRIKGGKLPTQNPVDHKLLYEELTYKIIGAGREVHKELIKRVVSIQIGLK